MLHVNEGFLNLTSNADGMFLCPIEDCLHIGFKSHRGLRKLIDVRHTLFYYFDTQPKIKRENIICKEKVKMKQTTHAALAFSLEDGVGKSFL